MFCNFFEHIHTVAFEPFIARQIWGIFQHYIWIGLKSFADVDSKNNAAPFVSFSKAGAFLPAVRRLWEKCSWLGSNLTTLYLSISIQLKSSKSHRNRSTFLSKKIIQRNGLYFHVVHTIGDWNHPWRKSLNHCGAYFGP